MNERRAREILAGCIDRTGALYCIGSDAYVAWTPGEEHIFLDGKVTAEYLEAIAWWMRHGDETKTQV